MIDTNGIPIPYAIVQVGGGVERAADSLGVVRLPESATGVMKLAVRRIGFAPFGGEVQPGEGGGYTVRLGPLVQGLDTVRAVAPRATTLSRTGFYDRMRRVRDGAMVGEFISPEELQSRRPSLISTMFRGRRGITLTRGQRNEAIILGRGGQCGMTILLDGVRMNGTAEQAFTGGATSIMSSSRQRPASADPTSIDELVVATQVMAIEIYPSTANAPAELIPLTGGGSCGIVALWTGPRQ